MKDFQRVFEVAVEICPRLMGRNMSMIHGWLAAGADAEADIIPTIQRLAEKNPEIGGLMYFNNAVMKAKKDREAAFRAVSDEIEIKPAVTDENKAKMIAKTLRQFGIRNSVNERWLEAYEEKFGEVQL